MKSVVTKYSDICSFCGRQATGEHHLVFGTAGRNLAEKDGLKVPICDDCHNMGEKLRRIHDNSMAEKLSKMLGQAIWEKEWILHHRGPDDIPENISERAREEFRKRYGKSYL